MFLRMAAGRAPTAPRATNSTGWARSGLAELQGPRRPRRYRAFVSHLLPNVEALIAELNSENPGVQYAGALAAAARQAATEDDLDAALAAIAATWRRC